MRNTEIGSAVPHYLITTEGKIIPIAAGQKEPRSNAAFGSPKDYYRDKIERRARINRADPAREAIDLVGPREQKVIHSTNGLTPGTYWAITEAPKYPSHWPVHTNLYRTKDGWFTSVYIPGGYTLEIPYQDLHKQPVHYPPIARINYPGETNGNVRPTY